jgi:hypothetical protein
MRYSPLVERYLMTHNYETINNVKKWKMLLTQRTEVQDIVDRKFKKFKQISDTALKLRDKLNEEFEKKCEELNQIHRENRIEHHKQMLKKKADHDELLKNNGLQEYANMLASLYQQKHGY